MKLLFARVAGLVFAFSLFGLAAPLIFADDPADPPADAPASEVAENEETAKVGPKMTAPEGLIRLDPNAEVWIDKQNKLVVADGVVVLREGQLEMFACPIRSKEHESVVAVNSKAYLVHTALLAIGAKEGTPVKWDPEYQAATGTEVDVKVLWLDADGKQHKTDAQQWVRNVKTQKPLEYNWVFAGSGFWKDEFDGKMHYLAEAGDLICVSNFPSATLDLPVESSQANAGLLYEAFTENIPPRGQPVRLVLIPKLGAEKEEAPKEQPAPEANEGESE